MTQIAPGTYRARAIDKIPTENDAGSLMIWLQCELIEYPTVKIQTWQTIISKDGTVQTKNLDNLKTIFGWDGINPLWFETADLSAIEFDVVVIDEPDRTDPSKIYSRIQWINPAGQGPSVSRPKPLDKASFMAKHSSKLRALAGPQPLTKPTPKPAPPAPPKPIPPPAPAGPTSTMESAWAEACRFCAGKPDDEIQKAWYAALEKMYPGKGNDLTPHEWELVRKSFEDDIPM